MAANAKSLNDPLGNYLDVPMADEFVGTVLASQEHQLQFLVGPWRDADSRTVSKRLYLATEIGIGMPTLAVSLAARKNGVWWCQYVLLAFLAVCNCCGGMFYDNRSAIEETES